MLHSCIPVIKTEYSSTTFRPFIITQASNNKVHSHKLATHNHCGDYSKKIVQLLSLPECGAEGDKTIGYTMRSKLFE